MADPIELLTLNESDQTRSEPGSPDDDTVLSRIVARTSGTPALAGGNTHTVAGAEGNDSLSGQILADATAAGTATASDNGTRIVGDTGSDYVHGELLALANAGGTATTTGDTLALIGGADNDTVSASLYADARDGGASVTGSRVGLTGGDGDDVLQVLLNASAEGSGTATLSDNRFALRGGAGDDSLTFTVAGTGNTALLDGGTGFDRVTIDYSQATADLGIDLSGGYDTTLPEGLRLRGIENVTLADGAGDDTFIGSDRDEDFRVGRGSDTVRAGGGGDHLSTFLEAHATDGATDVHSGDIDHISGDAGGDEMYLSGLAFARRGGAATLSHNISLLEGGGGADHAAIALETDASRDDGDAATATARHNDVTLLAGGGRDFIESFLFSMAGEGGTATTAHNLLAIAGGAQGDTVRFTISATAGADTGTATAITRGNTVLLTGDDGHDTVSVEIWGGASPGSSAAITDNVLTLAGGADSDWLSIGYDLNSTDDGTPTIAGNRFLLHGGSGRDILGITILDLGDNQSVLSGGRDGDRAMVDYRLDEDLAFDFSGGYDRTIERDVTLLGIERVWIFAGSGDDAFTGGSGNDWFDGNGGDDTAYLTGERGDYRVRVLDSGYVRITDLRDGAPDGSDLFSNVEHFVFAGHEVAIA